MDVAVSGGMASSQTFLQGADGAAQEVLLNCFVFHDGHILPIIIQQDRLERMQTVVNLQLLEGEGVVPAGHRGLGVE
jgi:hypothetical protein